MKYINILPAILIAMLAGPGIKANNETDHRNLRLKEKQSELILEGIRERIFGSSKADEENRKKYDLVTFMGDIEGGWIKVINWIANSPYVTLDKNDDFQFRNKEDKYSRFVFLGDAGDNGPETIKFYQKIVNFKKRFPKRVFLMEGNRDINKLRFNSELSEAGLPIPIKVGADGNPVYEKSVGYRFPEWAQAFAEFLMTKDIDPLMFGRDPKNLVKDRMTKLEWLASNTLGAGPNPNLAPPSAGFVENIRTGLTKLLNKSTPSSDAEVINYVMKYAKKPGILGRFKKFGHEYYHYKKNSQLVYFDKNTGILVAHGWVHRKAWGQIPGQPQMSVKTPEEREKWIQRLNKWDQDLVDIGSTIDGTDPDAVNKVMPLIEYQEPKGPIKLKTKMIDKIGADGKPEKDEKGKVIQVPALHKDGKEVKEFDGIAWGSVINDESVAVGRPTVNDTLSMDPLPIEEMLPAGVKYLVVGHTPIGNFPVVMKKDGLTVVLVDTTYASPVPTALPVTITSTGLDFSAPIRLLDPKPPKTDKILTILQKEDLRPFDYLVIYNSQKYPNIGDLAKTQDGVNYWLQGMVEKRGQDGKVIQLDQMTIGHNMKTRAIDIKLDEFDTFENEAATTNPDGPPSIPIGKLTKEQIRAIQEKELERARKEQGMKKPLPQIPGAGGEIKPHPEAIKLPGLVEP